MMLMVVIFLPIITYAQYGTAPNNYYPDNYNGATFTGVVADTKDNQVTLTFAKGSKTDTFTGSIEGGCAVPSKNGRLMMPTDIPKGTVMTAFFNGTTKKIDGKKVKDNVIIAIAFDEWRGQKIPEDKKTIYSCTEDRHLQFRAFQ